MRVVGLTAQDECRLSATTLERKLIAPVDNFATCALAPPGMHSMVNIFSSELYNMLIFLSGILSSFHLL